jgi:uncharacterized repeat protein (TIGR01451 family)
MNNRIKYWFLALALGVVPLMALAFLTRPSVAAGLWYVAPGGSDANDCQTAATTCGTINGALNKAAPGDSIELAIGTYTANLGNDVVYVTQSVTLLGGWNPGFTTQTGLSTVDGQGVRRGLFVGATATATVERFVFQDGNSPAGGGIYNEGVLTLIKSQVISNTSLGDGGGIDNSSGQLTIIESKIDGNNAGWQGGGLNTAFGNVTILSSTVSGNVAGDPCCSGGGGGGGIRIFSGDMALTASTVSGNVLNGGYQGAGINNGGTLTTTNSTISDNSGGDGDGIYSFVTTQALYNTTISGNSGYGLEVVAGHATLSNTILSGNGTSGYGATDCFNNLSYSGVVTSLGNNLIQLNYGCSLADTDIVGVDARLDTLQDNGGPAPTHALLPGSPAINGGSPGGCFGPDGLLANDERGYERLGRCDIGAFEAQALEASDKSVDRTSSTPGQPLRYTIRVANAGATAITGVVVTDTVPAGLIYANGSLTATSGNTNYSAGVITWTGTVNGNTTIAIQFQAATPANASLGTVITNTVIINGDGEVFSRRAVTTLALARLFLPVISKPVPGIQGHVTVNGAPAAGVLLELRHFDGQSFSTQLATQTDGTGYYNFDTAPSLPPGEIYYVRYLNTGATPGQLWFWGTRDITSYAAGGTVASNFDLADVTLVAPPGGATVALPAPFQWTLRSATPTDSYQLTVFDPNGTAFGQTDPLGYVNGVTLTGLPSDFHAGIGYGWTVNINSPDGGYGTAYYYRRVSFTNALAGSAQAVEGAANLEAAKAHVDSARP